MLEALQKLNLKDWLIVAATVAGPVLAVQAQKWVERWREQTNRKKWIFQTLMATRGSRISMEHVQALNMIELAFYGLRRFWRPRPRKSERAVLEAWTSYLTHLNTPVPQNEAGAGVWNGTSNELFVNLLVAMAPDVGYKFERAQLSGGGYTPTGHGNLASEQERIRKMTVELLSGDRPIHVRVTPQA